MDILNFVMILFVVALSIMLWILSKGHREKEETIENLLTKLRSVQHTLSLERAELEIARKTLSKYARYGYVRSEISPASGDWHGSSFVAIDPYGKEFTYYKYEYYRLKEENALLSKMLYQKVEDWEEKDKDTIIENVKT